jgi:hypothetical protein
MLSNLFGKKQKKSNQRKRTKKAVGLYPMIAAPPRPEVLYPMSAPPPKHVSYRGLQPNYLTHIRYIETRHPSTYLTPNYYNGQQIKQVVMDSKYSNLNPNYGSNDSEIHSINRINVSY